MTSDEKEGQNCFEAKAIFFRSLLRTISQEQFYQKIRENQPFVTVLL